MFPFLISLLSGLSTLIGAFVIFIKCKDYNKFIGGALSFAAGVMITVSLIDLLPTSIMNLSNKYGIIPALLFSFIFLVIGIILSLDINKYILIYENTSNNKLYKTGVFSMIAIILHNVPEGIATYLTTVRDAKLGITLAVAIALHNIPEGISISVPIFFSTKSKFKAIFYTFISGISEFFGAIIAYLFLSNFASEFYLNLLFCLIAGIMLSLSIDELVPTSITYISKISILFYFVLGCSFMALSHFII